MIQKYFLLILLNTCCFLQASVQKTLTREDCTATLREIFACKVGAASLDKCRGCMTEKELLAKAVTATLFSNNNSLFKSEEELREAALQESKAKNDPALVMLALENPCDQKVQQQCALRATELLIQAKECEISKDPKRCLGVCSPKETMEQCASYFEGRWPDFYNSYHQLIKAKELALFQNKGELAIELTKDVNFAKMYALTKRMSAWGAFCAAAAILYNLGY